jgi:hypothetical protein
MGFPMTPSVRTIVYQLRLTWQRPLWCQLRPATARGDQDFPSKPRKIARKCAEESESDSILAT